jgi:hypothetical protein
VVISCPAIPRDQGSSPRSARQLSSQSMMINHLGKYFQTIVSTFLEFFLSWFLNTLLFFSLVLMLLTPSARSTGQKTKLPAMMLQQGKTCPHWITTRFYVAELTELFRLKCASHRYTADNNSTHFKRNNPLVCGVSARYNHGSTGSKQVYLARRRVYNHSTAHQLLIYRNANIITNLFQT